MEVSFLIQIAWNVPPEMKESSGKLQFIHLYEILFFQGRPGILHSIPVWIYNGINSLKLPTIIFSKQRSVG